MIENPTKYAYLFQCNSLAKRFYDLTRASELRDTTEMPVLMDTSVIRDYIMTWVNSQVGNISVAEWQSYLLQFKALWKKFGDLIDVVVFLDDTPQHCMDRLKQRNRKEETTVSLKYLECLNQAHVNFESIFLFEKKFEIYRLDWHPELRKSDLFRDLSELK
jgi:deoxyadenosine/deoxycytidine kinase